MVLYNSPTQEGALGAGVTLSGASHIPVRRAPVRVALLDHTAALGGGEIALLNLVTHIDRSHYTPIVILFSEGPLVTKLRDAGIETHVEPISARVLDTRKDSLGAGALLRIIALFACVRFIARLTVRLRRLNVALVHTNSLKSDLFGAIPAKLSRLPLLWHIRDRVEIDYLPSLVVKVFRRLCRFLPNYIIANSAATLATLHLSPGRLGRARVVHDGTDHLELWEQRRKGHAQPIRDESTLTVGLIGRITRWKGQDVFVRAAATVRQRFPQARFQIIGAALFGETEYEAEVHALVKTLGLGETVEFLGMRSDIPELIDRLDIVVHASTSPEPFGQVVIEGMAAAKPVIATRAGGIPEIVVDGETGVLVPMSDPAALADAICRLAGDPNLRAALGEAGQARVRDHFTIRHTAERIRQCYDDALGSV